jgi:hypothetical protein
VPVAAALARDPEATTSIRVVVVGYAQGVACVATLVGNFLFWRDAWPLFAVFSVQLTWGLYLFSRILIRKN